MHDSLFAPLFLRRPVSKNLVNELDEKIRNLRADLDGVRGAVLRETNMEAYQQKQRELDVAMREYYQTFYGDRVSMP